MAGVTSFHGGTEIKKSNRKAIRYAISAAENVMIRDHSIIILFVDMAARERKYARTQRKEMLIWISECRVGLELYFYFCSLALNFIAWHFTVLAFYSDVVKTHNCTATPSSSTAVLLSWEFPTRNGTSKPANYTVRESGYSKLYPLCKTKICYQAIWYW